MTASAAMAGLVLSLSAGLAPAAAAPTPIQVGTYNVHDPDKNTPAPWSQRLPGIVQNILSQNLAVVGIQELYEDDEREGFLSALNAAAGTTDAYQMTLPPQNSGGYDNRIVYDTRSVTLVTAGSIVFANQSVGDTRREMTWAVFQYVNGTRFLVVNTHLCPTDDGATKRQWKELLLNTVGLRAAYGGLPVFAIGDFNTTKFERPARRLLKKMYKNGFGDVLGQTYRSYTTSHPRAVGPERINANFGSSNAKPVAKKKNGNSIDWIFASNQLDVTRYALILRQDLSDHNMVTATIVLP